VIFVAAGEELEVLEVGAIFKPFDPAPQTVEGGGNAFLGEGFVPEGAEQIANGLDPAGGVPVVDQDVATALEGITKLFLVVAKEDVVNSLHRIGGGIIYPTEEQALKLQQHLFRGPFLNNIQ
jgi:hypothetical protein